MVSWSWKVRPSSLVPHSLTFAPAHFLVVEDLLSPTETQSLAERTDMIARGETGNPAEVIQVEPEVGKAKTGSDPGGPGVSAGARRDMLTPEEQGYSVRKRFNLCDTDDVMFGHAANPKIVDVIADLLGCDDIKVYGDQLFMKNPGGSSPLHARHAPRLRAS